MFTENIFQSASPISVKVLPNVLIVMLKTISLNQPFQEQDYGNMLPASYENVKQIDLKSCFRKIMHCVKSVQIRSYFWSVFSCIRNQYGDLRSKSRYSVRIQENTDQK